ncbi:MAG TPA: DMT family transporter [Bacillota bacterium]|jgi:transporter family-2 protein|nr:DMT family transporter [Bacillota bacterium]HOA34708.1 DMT family transporter [Bacillota bacterium]HOJ83913.1 DMT family transporter [Bacillota bacterium]HOL15891.1 DMT family transporter [Bacillota bacterium]HPZ11175.1 DMT family transporter [Bacillota bacterium]
MEIPFLALLIAAIAGMAMALQGSLNAALGKIIGTLETTFVVHIVGIAVIMSVLYLFRLGKGNLLLLKDAPWYTYLGGVLGVLIIFGVAVSIPRAGVANATTAIIIGQLITALLIDQFGLFGLEKVPFTLWKGLGLACLAAGGYLMFCR